MIKLPAPSSVSWDYDIDPPLPVTDVSGDSFEVHEVQIREWREGSAVGEDITFKGYRLKADGSRRRNAIYGAIYLRHDDPLEAEVRGQHFEKRALA